ncbi:MAG TPA: hypothetical protein VER03_26135 [Bryobacteraceae bacterium]|nr:hypothetical protein [Bryobacteraceae bacterium]
MDTHTTAFGIRAATRPKRRLLVLGLYASYVSGCVFAAGVRSSSGAAFYLQVALLGAAFLVLSGCWLGLATLLREYGFPGDSRVFASKDERQTAVRHEAFVRSFQILSTIVCVGSLCLMLAADYGLWLPDRGFAKPLVFGAILVCTSLPSSIIAWTEPDAPQDAL